MKDKKFKEWYEENKEGLKEPYKTYADDMRREGHRPDPMIIWASERFNSVKE
jgi:hypothetical protein